MVILLRFKNKVDFIANDGLTLSDLPNSFAVSQFLTNPYIFQKSFHIVHIV